MRNWMIIATILVAFCVVCTVTTAFAQDGETSSESSSSDDDGGGGGGGATFIDIVFRSGPMSLFLWLIIFGALFAAVWFVVDCSMTVRPSKIMPQTLINSVNEAMAQGDVLKALKCCEDEPGPMANILTAGFSHVEEGFETIQEAVGVAADFEGEKLMQRISYLAVCGNLAPMLGLLGTVQGMIGAFAKLALMGSAQVDVLSRDISQALYTTAFGLTIAVPSVAAFYFFRNKANRIILRMEGITLELIKDLRNVEVVEE